MSTKLEVIDEVSEFLISDVPRLIHRCCHWVAGLLVLVLIKSSAMRAGSCDPDHVDFTLRKIT